MPKTRTATKSHSKHPARSSAKTAPKEEIKKFVRPVEDDKLIEIDLEEKIIDPDLVAGEETEEELEEDAVLDDEEVDPFKDKWEE